MKTEGQMPLPEAQQNSTRMEFKRPAHQSENHIQSQEAKFCLILNRALLLSCGEEKRNIRVEMDVGDPSASGWRFRNVAASVS